MNLTHYAELVEAVERTAYFALLIDLRRRAARIACDIPDVAALDRQWRDWWARAIAAARRVKRLCSVPEYVNVADAVLARVEPCG